MILLSVGHYFEAPGACNDDGICEWEIARGWMNKIYHGLIPHLPVSMVRGEKLGEKVRFINNHTDVKIAVELHFNSNVNAKGSETLHYPGSKSGKEFAEIVQKHFYKREIFQPNRGAKPGYHQMDPTKPIDYFLRKTKCTSIIIEPDFISQIERIEKWEHEGCQAIIDAIFEFYVTHHATDNQALQRRLETL